MMTRVVVAIIENSDGQFLIQQRPEGKPCAGLWEFPGGKIEHGESPMQALCRELKEELNLVFSPTDFTHFLQFEQDSLQLEFYRVEDTQDRQVQGLEQQQWCWVDLEAMSQYSFPQPNYAVIDALNQID